MSVWKDVRAVTKKDIECFLNSHLDAEGWLFFELKRVMDLVEESCLERGMWHLSFVENVVCDEIDQAVFRKITGWPQYLLCSGDMSRIRQPRFFWINEMLGPCEDVLQEPGHEYTINRGFGEKERMSCWVAPYWRWVSELEPVALPTFTRSIPRSRPPIKPAGISHSPKKAQSSVA